MTPISFAKHEINGVCSLRIAIDWQKRGRDMAIMVAIGTFLAIIDPYQATATLPLWGRWIYWTGLIIFGSLAGQAIILGIEALLPGLPVPAQLLLTSLLIAVLITAAIIFIQGFVGPYVPVSFWLRLYALVWVICAAMTAIGYVIDQNFSNKELPRTGDGTSTFMERLPVKYRGATLYAVASEDHYLRVYTDSGEELILMRLADAIRELDGADGLQTHRSWWVAHDGVADSKRKGGRILLVLKSGSEVPVSRSYAKAVREHGLT